MFLLFQKLIVNSGGKNKGCTHAIQLIYDSDDKKSGNFFALVCLPAVSVKWNAMIERCGP